MIAFCSDMATIESLAEEIELLKARNARVDERKAWESSVTRRLSIAVLTYAVVSTFFFTMGNARPLVDALVPTAGFLLSTLSLRLVRHIWAERVYGRAR